MDISRYHAAFVDEAGERLQAMNASLLELERNPGDREAANELFRAAHTLKGSSSTMGFQKIADLTHRMEDVLHAARGGEAPMTAGAADLLLRCADAIEAMLGNVIETSSEGDEDYSALSGELERLAGVAQAPQPGAGGAPADRGAGQAGGEAGAGGGERIAGSGEAGDRPGERPYSPFELSAIAAARAQGLRAYEIRAVLSEHCVMKAARAFVVFQALERRAEIIRTLPPVEDIEEERFGLEFRATALSAMQAGELGKALSGFSEVDAIEIAEIGEAPDGASAGANAGVGAVSGAGVRAAGAKAEAGEGAGGAEAAEAAGAPDAAGAASREGAAPAPESAGALPPGEPLAAGPASAAAATAGAPARKRLPMSKTVKVDIARLDALLNLVSELIIEKSRLQGVAELAGAPRLAGELEYLDRLASSLHEMTMRARMVSIGSVFSRFPKMVRDISQALGKEVELEIAGEDTELDRTVIDELGEPLLHILRNCIDHGIEDAETRARLGKPARGRVRMSASQSGADVLVEVRDDGGGIDIEKVRAKAAASGIVSGERAAAMTDGEAARLVFEPSLSTKDQVSELSGRGVGLDVVKTKIESFGGSVEIETAKSAGTKISIRLPVSLVVVSALLVEAGSEKYAVSLSAVAEVVKVGADEIGRTQGRMVMLLRDALIPVISLAEALGCDPAAAAAEHAGARPAAPQDILTIVVARIGEKYFGMIADAVLGQHELVQKPLGPFFQNAKLVSGATILGDGSVALMLNAGALLI